MSDLSSLRLVTVPHAAPPYDCQVHGARCPASTDVAPPAAPALPDTAVVPVLPVLPALPDAAVVPVLPVLPDAVGGAADPGTAWPRRLAVVIVEVLAGVRPDRQLVPLATDRVRARVRNLAPLLAAERRPRIARIVMSRPADRVVEMTVVVTSGARSRALAMRFEHVAARPGAPGWPARPARWLCTALEAG
jgi:hypothetical protein